MSSQTSPFDKEWRSQLQPRPLGYYDMKELQALYDTNTMVNAHYCMETYEHPDLPVYQQSIMFEMIDGSEHLFDLWSAVTIG